MRRMFLGILVVATLTAFFLGLASNVSIRTSAMPGAAPSVQIFDNSLTNTPSTIETSAPIQSARNVVIQLPAVDKDGNGALADFTVEVVPGRGRVFIGFDASPLVNSDTQSSLRIALDVARRLANADSKNLDVFYTFSTQSDVVGGQSAGAAATIATLAALSGNSLRHDVLITGTINPDGTIGPVGDVLQKAKAVKNAGYKTFLVPVGESVQSTVVENCDEKSTENSVVRSCSSSTQSVDVASQVPGLKIVEVKDIAEAYRMLKSA